MPLSRKKGDKNIHREYRDFAHVSEHDPELLKLNYLNSSRVTYSHTRRLHHRRPPGGVDIPFPVRLHTALSKVEEEGLGHIISWQQNGRCFLVHEPKLFEKQKCLNMKFTSFQRQLNLYGFRRLTKGDDRGCYYHELFLRGKAFLCQYIKRTRIKGTGVKVKLDPNTEPDFYTLPPVESEKGPKLTDIPTSKDALKIEVEASHFSSQHRERDGAESSDEKRACRSSENPKSKCPSPPPFLVSPDTTPRSCSTMRNSTQNPSSSTHFDRNGRKWFDIPFQMPFCNDCVSLLSQGQTENPFVNASEPASSDVAIMTNSSSSKKEVSNSEKTFFSASEVPTYLSTNNRRDEDSLSAVSDCESTLSFLDLLDDFDPDEDFRANDSNKTNSDEVPEWNELAEASFSSDLLIDSCSCLSLSCY